ncbi:hypothetical protein THAOC_20507, partial [Thalassiosira oceanica]
GHVGVHVAPRAGPPDAGAAAGGRLPESRRPRPARVGPRPAGPEGGRPVRLGGEGIRGASGRPPGFVGRVGEEYPGRDDGHGDQGGGGASRALPADRIVGEGRRGLGRDTGHRKGERLRDECGGDASSAERTALIVAHGNLGQALLGTAMGWDASGFNDPESVFGNCGLCEVDFGDAGGEGRGGRRGGGAGGGRSRRPVGIASTDRWPVRE